MNGRKWRPAAGLGCISGADPETAVQHRLLSGTVPHSANLSVKASGQLPSKARMVDA
jgi:hypothetical protein